MRGFLPAPFFFFNLLNLTSSTSRRKKMRFIRQVFSVSLGFLFLPETDSVFVHKSLSEADRLYLSKMS